MYCEEADCRIKERRKAGEGCSGMNGACDMKTGKCRCKEGFGGCNCKINCRTYDTGCNSCMTDKCLKCDSPKYFKCPDKQSDKCIKFCPNNCGGHKCDITSGKCECDDGYGGEDCSTKCSTHTPNCMSCTKYSCLKCDFNKGYNPKPYCKRCMKKICECNGRGVCGCDGNCQCYPGFAGPGCLGSCTKIVKGCVKCQEDKKTRNSFTGKFIWRCSKCGAGYNPVPAQTSSGSDCNEMCPPGEVYKYPKCVACGTMYKFKYLATCARFGASDICHSREASDPEEMDKLMNRETPNNGVKVMLKGCQRNRLDPKMMANETTASANQFWLQRPFKVTLPAEGQNRGKQETFYTLTVPHEYLIRTKMVEPTPDYVPVAGQEYCLTALPDGATGKGGNKGDQLVVQLCEYKKETSKLRDLQLFKVESQACGDNAGSNAFRSMPFISLKKTKQMISADPVKWIAKFGDQEKTDHNRWTAFEEKLLPTC